MRAMISSSETTRRVTPRCAAASAASSSTRGSGMRVRLPAFVSVPSRARLLAVAAQCVEAIGNGRLRSLGPRLPDRFQVLADAPADVDAGDVLHPERSHRITEVREGVVDLRDAGAFLEEEVRLAHVVREHAVGDESETVTDDHANLVQLFRELHRRRDHLRAGGAPADDLEQLHHVGGAEEVVPDDLCPAGRSPRRARRCRVSTCSTREWRRVVSPR